MRKRVLTLIAIGLVMPIGTSALASTPKKPRSRPTVTSPPVGSAGSGGGGATGVIGVVGTGTGSQTPGKKPARTSCPGYERQNVRPINVTPPSEPVDPDSPPPPLYGIFVYRCNGGAWIQIVGCVLNCPPTAPQFIEPPDPQVITDRFNALPIEPDGWFAPPIHTGASAITGLRLYASVNPASYRTITDTATLPGNWWATGTATPGEITIEANNDTHNCNGPGPDPRTAAGRENNDCYVLITDVPSGGRETAKLTIEWLIEVTSNVPGIENDSWYRTTTSNTQMTVKELQAVIVK